MFLLSRIKEARDAGASDHEAVAIGLERTGRVVTAAALLVPSLMMLLGPRNWWAPAPLRRLHERFGMREGGPPVSQPATTHG